MVELVWMGGLLPFLLLFVVVVVVVVVIVVASNAAHDRVENI